MALYAYDRTRSLDPRQLEIRCQRDRAVHGEDLGAAAERGLLRHYPRCWPALLTVDTARARWRRLVLLRAGDPERAFDEFQVAAKFWRLTGPLVGEHRTGELLRRSYAALDEKTAEGR